ncbi:MAG: prephenate dehydratase [Ornithinimicrobium sp.]
MTVEPAPGGVDAVYLGPAGTFTELALAELMPADSSTLAVHSIQDALDMVADGSASNAIVPFENSVEGSVSVTLDALIHGEPLVIVAESHVAVRFVVMARPGTELADVRRVGTHPHAAAQTRAWSAHHLPQAEVLPETSTARAAEMVSAGHYDAAIAAAGAATRHGLQVLAENVADRPGAVTRFVRLTRPGPPPAPTGADTTTLAAFLRHNHPGALLELLEQFTARGVDLTRLESRPTGEALGQYCFAIEADGHLDEPRMAEALTGLHRTCRQVRYLGSYPRAERNSRDVPSQASGSAYQRARAWVESLTDRP